MTKRIAVIQDLSCIGRCSLGVALSVLPAMGAEVAALPTAILSTHTAFDGFTFADFTSEAEKIIDHWERLEMRFDAVLIGYLGSERLIRMTARFLKMFADGETQVILDPAFADNGALYKGFDAAYVRGIRDLCACADVILPNVTEACFLLGEPFEDSVEGTKRTAEASKRLLSGRLKNVLMTSARFDGGQTGLICAGENAFAYPHERLTLSCHGTGDLFASVFAGMRALNRSLEDSAKQAADFTRECIAYSMTCEDHRWYGVDYEPKLKDLILRL